ncbi:hypothetical protein SESBI_13617 [Sesbania bispinosa]|nr:hypothetical protein SESBI_13617 [Sesbania bispinosa]
MDDANDIVGESHIRGTSATLHAYARSTTLHAHAEPATLCACARPTTLHVRCRSPTFHVCCMSATSTRGGKTGAGGLLAFNNLRVIKEVICHRVLSASSLCYYISYLFEVYLHDTDKASKFSFISPYELEEKNYVNGYIVEALKRHTNQDHLVMVPCNVGCRLPSALTGHCIIWIRSANLIQSE